MPWLGWIRTSVVQRSVSDDAYEGGIAMRASRIRDSWLRCRDELYELVALRDEAVV